MAPVDRRPRHRETGDRHRLAPRRLPPLLALALPAARWSAEGHRCDPRLDPASGPGERRLGSAQDPRGTPETRLGRLRTNRGAVFAANPPSWRPRERMARFPPQSSGGDRGLRLLHRPHGNLSCVVLLLCNRTWTAEDPPLQRDPTSDGGLGGPATTRGIPRGNPISLRDSGPGFDI